MREFREIIEEVMAETSAVAGDEQGDFVMASHEDRPAPAQPRVDDSASPDVEEFDDPVVETIVPADPVQVEGNEPAVSEADTIADTITDTVRDDLPVSVEPVEIQDDVREPESPVEIRDDLQDVSEPVEIRNGESEAEDRVGIESDLPVSVEPSPISEPDSTGVDPVDISSPSNVIVDADDLPDSPGFVPDDASDISTPFISDNAPEPVGNADQFAPGSRESIETAESLGRQVLTQTGEMHFHEVAEEELERFRVQVDDLIRPQMDRIRYAAMGAINEQVSNLAYQMEGRHML